MQGPTTIKTPLRQRLHNARVSVLPLLVWIGAVVLIVELWHARPGASQFSGLARGQEAPIVCPVDGTVSQLLVTLYQPVEEGQVLATIDDSPSVARILTAQAELARLSAELRAERTLLELDEQIVQRDSLVRLERDSSKASLEYPAQIRAFETQRSNLSLQLLETQLELATRKLEADRVKLRLRRSDSLAEQLISSRSEVEDLEIRLEQEETHAAHLSLVEAGLKDQLQAASARLGSLKANYKGPAPIRSIDIRLDERLAAWKAALEVQQMRIAELTLERESYLIRAPISGRIAQLSISPGQFLLAGSTLMLLTVTPADKVDLWVPASAIAPPRIGDLLTVQRSLGKRSEDGIECAVLSISPRVELMPERLWRDLRMPEYGRATSVGPVTALGLVPGELVSLDFAMPSLTEGN